MDVDGCGVRASEAAEEGGAQEEEQQKETRGRSVVILASFDLAA